MNAPAIKSSQLRGKPTAVVALARRLARITFAVWRDGAEFDPLLLTQRGGVYLDPVPAGSQPAHLPSKLIFYLRPHPAFEWRINGDRRPAYESYPPRFGPSANEITVATKTYSVRRCL